MGSKANYLEDAVLDHVLRNTALTSPTTVYMALFTADPTEAGTQTNEVANSGAYARTAITFAAASGGAITNSGTACTFIEATADWNSGSTIGWFMIMDSGTWNGGNALYHGALTVAKSVLNGQIADFPTSSIAITED